MNDITKTIINASSSAVMDSLYEDEPQSEEEALEREVVEVATKTPLDELYPKEEKYMDEDGYEDPYPKSRHKSAEAEMQDRLLTVPRRPKNSPRGSLWITNTNFIEQVALLNITKSEQKSLLRQWKDIQDLSTGDGNEAIVDSEQDEFALKIISYKSRSDNPEKGIRERTAHITNKTIADQTVTMPRSETQKSGFLNTILGRKIQQ